MMKSINAAGLNDLPIIYDLDHAIWPLAYGDILSQGQLKYTPGKGFTISDEVDIG